MNWVCRGGCMVVLAGMLAGCSKPDGSGSPQGAAQPREAPPPEPLVLALQWPSGRRIANELEWFQQLETFFPGVPEPLRTEIGVTQAYSLTVIRELDSTQREVRLEFGSVRLVSQQRGRPWFHYDSTSSSANDPSNAVAAALGRIPGTGLTMVVNTRGEVESIPELPKLLASLKEDAPQQARPLLDGFFGEESIKQMVELGRSLSDQPVRRGDHWPFQMKFSLGALGEISLNATNTFVDWERRQGRLCAALQSQGNFVGARGPLPGETSVDGSSRGQSWIDPKLGLLVESQISQTMQQLMRPGGANSQQGAITNRVEQRIHLRLTEAGSQP